MRAMHAASEAWLLHTAYQQLALHTLSGLPVLAHMSGSAQSVAAVSALHRVR